ncbi:MAG: membrane protein insertase YidC [Ruminococcaceae bacterium]|nr:membrane protein insertase YidC [Oscillospiraceae bacterium]
MFDFILKPIGLLLRFFNKIVGNQYIVSLLIFAIIIEVLMLPFAIKQQKNSIRQAKLRPKEMAIRKKYAGRDDQPTKQKMQTEIQELYQKEGFNPMGGCLPLLIQFPILIMLYNIVINPLKYVCGLSAGAISQIEGIVSAIEGAPVAPSGSNTIGLMAKVKNIMQTNPDAFDGVSGFSDRISSVKDLPNLSYGGVNLGLNPGFSPEEKIQYLLLLIPVLTFVVYFFSAKITRKLSYQPVGADSQMGCSNKVMDIMMPAFSVYITFITPAAVGIYWIFKSILGVIKQYIMKKAMPIPEFTEEDYKAAEKEMGTKSEKPKHAAKSGKVVRSLHHIDDEDYDDTREEALRRKAILEEQAEKEKADAQEAASKSTILGGATVKDDDRPQRSKKKKGDAAEEKVDIVLDEKSDETKDKKDDE